MVSTEISSPPNDAISKVQFSPIASDPLLLVASWDNRVRMYDIDLNTTRAVHTHTHAVLDATFLRDSSTCISGGLARDLRQYDFEREQDFLVGKHTDAVRSVGYSPESNLVFSGSWDKTVCAWDCRTKNICHRIELEGKVFCMSVSHYDSPYGKIIVGDSTKSIRIYDLRKLEKPEEIRPDIMKYQLRCIESFANGKGFAVGSVEGRVAIEYFNPKNNALKPSVLNSPVGEELMQSSVPVGYAFKCHRDKISAEDVQNNPRTPQWATEGMDKIYPVNSISFHPKFNTFATGGSDGNLAVWDPSARRRIWRISNSYVTSISSLNFSPAGDKLAVAVSYDFSEEQNLADKRLLQFAQLSIWNVEDEHVRPKAPKPAA